LEKIPHVKCAVPVCETLACASVIATAQVDCHHAIVTAVIRERFWGEEDLLIGLDGGFDDWSGAEEAGYGGFAEFVPEREDSGGTYSPE
jgi:hypothetical protein